jgi:hypothetical protein
MGETALVKYDGGIVRHGMIKSFSEIPFGPRPNGFSGIQAVAIFSNGWGASVIRGFGTYGSEEGLYELAVISGDHDSFSLRYDSGITDDVLGHLTEDEVVYYLNEIAKLPKEGRDLEPNKD